MQHKMDPGLSEKVDKGKVKEGETQEDAKGHEEATSAKSTEVKPVDEQVPSTGESAAPGTTQKQKSGVLAWLGWQRNTKGTVGKQSLPTSEKVMSYQERVAHIWRHHELEDATHDYKNLVRYATMAASSHNTQPWKFKIEPGRITILPDLERRCPAVDPDDHHLYTSLGCAAANLIEAASAASLSSNTHYDESIPGLVVGLENGPKSRSALFDAIPKRQCSRTAYDGTRISDEELQQLKTAGSGDGVSVMFLLGEEKLKEVTEYVSEGNVAQIGDTKWLQELKRWIRFNGSHAVSTGDGLSGKSMGSPEAPTWLGNIIFRYVLSPGSQNKKDVQNILSSSGIAVFYSDSDDKVHWIEVGRCYERFALQAEALNIRTAFINQPVEVSELRAKFASWLGIGDRRPDLVVRFGHGPKMPPSIRRPVEEVIV